jgi:hypothetical protein
MYKLAHKSGNKLRRGYVQVSGASAVILIHVQLDSNFLAFFIWLAAVKITEQRVPRIA